MALKIDRDLRKRLEQTWGGTDLPDAPEWVRNLINPRPQPQRVQIDDGRYRKPDGVGIEVYTPDNCEIVRRNPNAN
jgi:hypothetical protein